MRLSLAAALASVSLAAAVVLSGVAVADEPATMQAGKWRSTTAITEFNMPGLPPQVAKMVKSRMGRPHTVNYCLKPEDIGKPGPGAFGGEGAKNCKYEDWTYRNGRMKAVVVCNAPGRGRMRMEMDGTGGPAGYNAKFNTTISGGPQGTITTRGTVTGKRTSSC